MDVLLTIRPPSCHIIFLSSVPYELCQQKIVHVFVIQRLALEFQIQRVITS